MRIGHKHSFVSYSTTHESLKVRQIYFITFQALKVVIHVEESLVVKMLLTDLLLSLQSF